MRLNLKTKKVAVKKRLDSETKRVVKKVVKIPISILVMRVHLKMKVALVVKKRLDLEMKKVVKKKLKMNLVLLQNLVQQTT